MRGLDQNRVMISRWHLNRLIFLPLKVFLRKISSVKIYMTFNSYHALPRPINLTTLTSVIKAHPNTLIHMLT
jgi:hypothetical protein